MKKKLSELKRFEVATLIEINGSEKMIQRLIKLGFVRNSEVKVLSKLPFKGPLTLSVQGSKIAIRYDDAENITIEVG